MSEDATPAAEEAAEELGVDLSEVEGTGKDGRVLKADVEATDEEPSEVVPEPELREFEKRSFPGHEESSTGPAGRNVV